MIETARSTRIVRSLSGPAPDADDERIVLRLEREALRADPPSVRFIGRSGPASPQGALQWPAFE